MMTFGRKDFEYLRAIRPTRRGNCEQDSLHKRETPGVAREFLSLLTPMPSFHFLLETGPPI